MEARTVRPWEMRLAEAMQGVQRDPSKRTLLEIGGLKAKALAAEIADWRALAAAPVAPTQDIHCQEFHELAMDYRAAPAFTGAPAAYKALCDYVNARLAPVAQPALPKLPSTPLEVVSFIGDKFDEWKSADSVEDYRYTLSVYDLLSAFQAYEDAQPADPDDMAANYDHSTHDKRMEVLRAKRDEITVVVAAPEGYTLVPNSPNEEMLRPDGFSYRLGYDQYQAMLAAAPAIKEKDAK